MDISYRNSLQKWRNLNLYYYRDIENFYKSVVREEHKVLEVGSNLGYLLNSLQPSYGLGIEQNAQAVEQARSNFPRLDFIISNAEEFRSSDILFDYILMANTISYLSDITQTLKNLHQSCQPSTRLILTLHNPSWEIILKIASLIGQRNPLPQLNWLSYSDVANLLHLCQFEVVCHSKRLLLPKNIPLISWFANSVIAPLPLFNQFCLNEHIIARPIIQISSPCTCSVIIPARNEEGNIEACITNMPQIGSDTEIIFVEGGSTDGTWDEILRVQQKYRDRFKIAAYKQSGDGKKNAVWQGFERASGDVLIILDADLTVQPRDLVYFFEAIASGTCEFANGCRLIYPLSKATMPWLNRIANRIFAFLLSYLLNTQIKDSLCGTKAISRQNYQRLARNRDFFGDFDPFGDFDLLFGAAKLGLKIMDIPVRYFPRTYGKSNIHHIKEGFVLLKTCLHAAKKIKFI
ncbi:glycosyltransferase [Pseudanabaena sp. UWO310]|uniref:glycosyltransferase n=1 Tax=Pseudanabaena sp. UWO310 TaxID=2480795 RepID=UPI00115B4A83|nr:glycosyltransferase [Pseudanabaena sp. UWO310]TYQ31197.1 glycosyltransferase [Pseudanabaena sp. UWO310]